MPRYKAITMQDLADRLQVSKVTISKALRDHPDISPATRQRIKQLAEEMGYMPNLIARNLAARRSQTLGLVVPKVAHSFFSRIIETIYNLAFDNGYEIVMMVSQEDAERERRHLQTLMAMKVDGILISVASNTKDFSIFQEIRRRGIPLVFFDRVLLDQECCTVQADDYRGAYLAVEHAIRAGYTKIAHLAGYRHTHIGNQRLQGFVDALREFDLEERSEWIVEGGFSERDGYQGLIWLWAQPQRPEVIFAVTFPVALGVMMAAREMGLVIPDDVDLICFGDSPINSLLQPSITCIDQPTEELAEQAFELLIKEIGSGEVCEPRDLLLPVQIKQYQTCKPTKL